MAHQHTCIECDRDFPCDRLMTDSETPSCDAPDVCEKCGPPLPLEAPQKAMLYRLTVWAKVPITDDVPDMTARDIEKQTFKLLKAADFDADCEVVGSEEIED